MYRYDGYRRCTGMAEGRQGDAIKSMGLVRLKTSVTMQPAREKRSDGRTTLLISSQVRYFNRVYADHKGGITPRQPPGFIPGYPASRPSGNNLGNNNPCYTWITITYKHSI
ncbi:unnamed protein product [Spodoptera exigua]|nr:unnamed protein product [Spodoptera exigua]